MDRNRRNLRRSGRDDSPPPPPPVAPAPPPMQMPQATAEQTQMMGMVREMFAFMQQTQQQLIAQQQQFMQQFAPAARVDPVVAPREVPRDRERSVSFPEVIKMTPKFFDAQNDATAAEMWIEEMEKAFDACFVPADRKLGLAVYQLKGDAYNWWREERGRIQEPLTWEVFRDAFFRRYFPESTRQQMAVEWLNLRQGSKSVEEYEAEFNRLLRFAGDGYRENERMKVQKFQTGLNAEIRHQVKSFELDTLSAVAHKARVIEQSKNDCLAQQARAAKFLGKRPSATAPVARPFKKSFSKLPVKSFGKAPEKSFKKPSVFQSVGKKWNADKKPGQFGKSEASPDEPVCNVCYGPHDPSACRWTPGACFSCGQTGHRSFQCTNKILRPIFCFGCKQRGHSLSECKERGKSNGFGNGNGKGKGFGRVYALQCEDTPTVDTLAGTLLVSAHDAYCLIDTGATHTCISETFMSACGLSTTCISDMSLCVLLLKKKRKEGEGRGGEGGGGSKERRRGKIE